MRLIISLLAVGCATPPPELEFSFYEGHLYANVNAQAMDRGFHALYTLLQVGNAARRGDFGQSSRRVPNVRASLGTINTDRPTPGVDLAFWRAPGATTPLL